MSNTPSDGGEGEEKDLPPGSDQFCQLLSGPGTCVYHYGKVDPDSSENKKREAFASPVIFL
jgi:hypothetical protein